MELRWNGRTRDHVSDRTQRVLSVLQQPAAGATSSYEKNKKWIKDGTEGPGHPCWAHGLPYFELGRGVTCALFAYRVNAGGEMALCPLRNAAVFLSQDYQVTGTSVVLGFDVAKIYEKGAQTQAAGVVCSRKLGAWYRCTFLMQPRDERSGRRPRRLVICLGVSRVLPSL